MNLRNPGVATTLSPAYEVTVIQSHEYEDLRRYSVSDYEPMKPAPPPPPRVQSEAGLEEGEEKEEDYGSEEYESITTSM